MIASRRPDDRELTSDYQRKLLSLVPGDDALVVLADQLHWMCELAGHLCTEQVDKLHRPYTWTIRQVIEHCADAERVFGYRILRAAAGDQTPLPSWDENAYAAARFGLGTFSNLISELGAVRQANRLLLARIQPSAWQRCVPVDSQPVSVRVMAWVAAGHLAHHLEIIEDRCQLTVQRYPENG